MYAHAQRAVAGWSLIAVALALLAASAVPGFGIVAFLAFLLFVAGLVFTLVAGPPIVTRVGVWIAVGYLALVLVAVFASTPFTVGKYAYYVNDPPSPLALGAQVLLVDALPVALVVAVGIALWPASRWPGRGLALIAALALGATLAITYLANAPTKATQAEADAAASLGSTAHLPRVVSA
ncbi:MAG: hypothetical protein ACYDCK_14300, partial [Thermoplasmatota archaeon]